LGGCLVLLGVPFYYYFRKKRQSEKKEKQELTVETDNRA
jgi:hypothetical protein